MSLLKHPIHRFLFKVLLWLPACFFLWYWLSGYWLAPIHWAMNTLFVKFLPSVISEIEGQGHLLEVVTRLNAPQGYAAGGILTFEIRPLVYAYSLPLYAALTLAAPAANHARKALYLGLGLLALLPFIAWGTGFDILKHLAFTLGAETASYIDFSGGRKELIVWGYQFGYLILPGVVPLAIWIALHRQFLQQLAPTLGTRTTEPEQP
jgi:hypothetical protein